MKNLIVNGDFEETSDICQTFVAKLVEILKENSNDYFRIIFTDNYRGEVYGYEHKPIFDKLTKWASNLKNLDDTVLQDLEKNFRNEYIVSYIKKSIEHINDMKLASNLEDLKIRYLLEYIEDITKYDYVVKTYNLISYQDLRLCDASENYSLHLKVLKSNENINKNNIEEMLEHFAKGSGIFTITSILDKDTLEYLDISDIFENSSFETSAFGENRGYKEIVSYLDKQAPNWVGFLDIKIDYQKNR